jgi:hypothetical protein
MYCKRILTVSIIKNKGGNEWKKIDNIHTRYRSCFCL